MLRDEIEGGCFAHLDWSVWVQFLACILPLYIMEHFGEGSGDKVLVSKVQMSQRMGVLFSLSVSLHCHLCVYLPLKNVNRHLRQLQKKG